jgi:hypothetical protein
MDFELMNQLNEFNQHPAAALTCNTSSYIPQVSSVYFTFVFGIQNPY